MKIDEKLVRDVFMKAVGSKARPSQVKAILEAYHAVMRERREEVVNDMFEAGWWQQQRAAHIESVKLAFDRLFPENPQ